MPYKFNLVLILLFVVTLSSFGQASLEQEEPQVLYDNAVYLMNARNYGGARNYFEEYLKTGDKRYEIEANYQNAICALKLYHLDGETLIQNFIAENPNAPQSGLAYVEMGEYFFQDRDYKQAVTFLSKVDQKSVSKEKKPIVQYKLGYSYFALKKFDQALIEFNKVKKGNSKYKAPSHYYAGFVEYDQANYSAALADYQMIQNDKAFSSSIPYMITSIHYKSESYQELVNYSKPILDNNQRVQQRGQMAILLAESYYELGEFNDAYFYFTQADKTEKFTAQSVFHFGVSASKAKNSEQAISLLKSIAGQGNEVGAMASYTLGQLYLEEDNTEFAFTAFKSVMDNKFAGSLSENAMFISGKLAYDLGRFSESITILTNFRGSFPNSNDISKVDDILAQAFLNTRNYKPALDYIDGLEVKSETIWRAYQQATFHYGVDFYNDRNFTEAISYFNKSLEHPLVPAYTLRANLWIAEAYSVGRRYEDALPFYNTAINVGINANPEDYWRAVYGRGYALYNTAKYDKALVDFKGFVNSADKESILYGDALVRLADCYYAAKEYDLATSYFGEAIRGTVNEKDYAYYQAGVIYGILDNTEKALSFLDRVINVYPGSAYYDDALFDKGLIQIKKEKYAQAIITFKKLITEKPRSRYVSFALERSAVANFNLHNYSETVSLYKDFIEKYPNNPGISDALIGLQESMRLNGNGAEFEQILANFRAKNPDIGGLEKVEFESLRGLYNTQEYARAARGFSAYLNAYPDDFNSNEVRYLLAESLYRLDKPDSALVIYKILYKEGGETRINNIIERIADIELENRNWRESNKYYKELADIAVSNNQKLRAWLGLMNGYFALSEHDSTLTYVELLIKNGGSRNDFIVAATLKKGLTLMNLGQFDNALLNFEKTTELAKDKNGAEAQYYIGVILNQLKDYQSSNEALYEIPEQYGMYTEWLDKGFLLVAENFIAQKEYFQAKATLQSIIDNSGDPVTIQTATERYEWVSNEEAKAVNLVPDSLNTVEIDTSSNNEGN